MEQTNISNLHELYEYIYTNVPNSKIFVIGGSDEVCKSGYRSKLFDHVVHLDSQIDVKPKFKHQIDDRDKNGNLLFMPQFFEHHRSYLREVFED